MIFCALKRGIRKVSWLRISISEVLSIEHGVKLFVKSYLNFLESYSIRFKGIFKALYKGVL